MASGGAGGSAGGGPRRPLSVAAAGRECVLLKVPAFVAAAWGSDAAAVDMADAGSGRLGTLRVERDPSVDPGAADASEETFVTLEGPTAARLPKEYVVNASVGSAPAAAFSCSGDGRFAVEGKVRARARARAGGRASAARERDTTTRDVAQTAVLPASASHKRPRGALTPPCSACAYVGHAEGRPAGTRPQEQGVQGAHAGAAAEHATQEACG